MRIAFAALAALALAGCATPGTGNVINRVSGAVERTCAFVPEATMLVAIVKDDWLDEAAVVAEICEAVKAAKPLVRGVRVKGKRKAK